MNWRVALLALAAASAVAPAALAAAPDRVLKLEAGLWDAPALAERQAQADLAEATRTGDPERRFEAALRLALAASAQEHPAEARRAAQLIRKEVEARPDPQARCLLAAIPEAPDDERSSRARLQLQQEMQAARASGARWCVARLQVSLGQIFDGNRQLQEAVEALQEGLRLFEQEGDEAAAASAHASLAWLYARMDDHEESLQRAIEHGQAAVAAARRLNLRSLTAISLHNLAGPLMRVHRTGEAQDLLSEAMRLVHQIGNDMGVGYVARLQARAAETTGHPLEALALYEKAEAVFTQGGEPTMALVCLFGRLRALAALGRWNEVERALERAQPALRQVEDSEILLERLQMTMRLKEARGDFQGALVAAKAWVTAQQENHAQENRRAAADAQERHESARKEAENLRLRQQQQADQSREHLLSVTLLLALALVGVLAMHGIWQFRVRARWKQLAEVDDLTRLPNRRSILDHLQRSLDQQRHLAGSVAVGVLDIDHFKQVNDRYGHEVGDSALRTFAAVCERTLRRQDRIGRLGGEEFLAVFQATSDDELRSVFERLRAALRDAPIFGMAAEERLSFSMGVAFAAGADSVHALTLRADKALYEAKSGGRDRMVVSR